MNPSRLATLFGFTFAMISMGCEKPTANGVQTIAQVEQSRSRENAKSLGESSSRRRLPVHEALRVAMEELQKNGIPAENDFILQVTRRDSGWTFWFEFLPRTPEWEFTVQVDDDGTVVAK